MADELIDIYTVNNEPLNTPTMKSVAHRDGLWHRGAHIWIYNSSREILIQLRAKDKALYPGVWDISSAGHSSVGEEPIATAVREVQEEIGLTITREQLQFFKVRQSSKSFEQIVDNEFAYIYFLKFTGNIADLILQKEEVESIKFISIDNLEEELENNRNQFVPHGYYWFEVIEEVKKLGRISAF